MDRNEYIKYITDRSKRSNTLVNCVKAFISGGIICIIGRLFYDLYLYCGIEDKIALTLSSATLVFLAGLLTGIGIFDKIAKFCGAGALVPITGFSNAVTAPAIEAKNEGIIMGIGSEMFKIAGPVIIYGNLVAVIYGVIYYICTKTGVI